MPTLVERLRSQKESATTLTDRLSRQGEPNVPVTLPPLIDVYDGIADPNDVSKKAVEVQEQVERYGLPYVTPERYLDIMTGRQVLTWEDITPKTSILQGKIIEEEKPKAKKELPEKRKDIPKFAGAIGQAYGLSGTKFNPENLLSIIEAIQIEEEIETPISLEEYYKAHPEKRPRQYKNFINELLRNIGGSSLRIFAGITGNLATGIEQTWGPSFDALLSTENLNKYAEKMHEKSATPDFSPAADGGWKGFVATSIGQAGPYMAGAIASTYLTGTPMGAFGFAFAVEGDDAYRTAIENGATEEQANMNRFIVGTINGVIEQIQISQIYKFANVGRGSVKQIVGAAKANALKKVLAQGGKITYKAASHAVKEAIEETLQEFTSIVAESRFNKEAWDNASYRLFSSGLGGGVVGLVLGVGGRVSSRGIVTFTDGRQKTRLSKGLQAKLGISKALANKASSMVSEGVPVTEVDQMLSQAMVLGEEAVLAEVEEPTIAVEPIGRKAEAPPPRGKAEIVQEGQKLPISKEPLMAFKIDDQIVFSKEATIHAEIPLTEKQHLQVVTSPKDLAGFISEGKFFDREEFVARQKAKPPTEAVEKVPEPLPTAIEPEIAPVKPTKPPVLESQGKIGVFDEGQFIPEPQEELDKIVAKVRKNEGEQAADITKSLLDKGIQTESVHDTKDEIIVGVSNLSEENKAILEDAGLVVEKKSPLSGEFIHFAKEVEVVPAKPKVAKKPVIKPKPKGVQIEEKRVEKRDILGGVDPVQRIHGALREAKAIQPLGEVAKKAELRRRVGAAAGAMKSNVKKGVPTEEAIFKSTGLLKGELAEYDRAFDSIEDILEPGAKEAAYQQIYNHPGLQYFEIVNTTTSFKKLLAGTFLTPGDVQNIERVFGKEFKDITDVRMERSGLYERLVTLWKAGLLTGIKTSGLNIMSTAAHAVSETAKDVPASLIDTGISLFSKERTLAFTAQGFTGGFRQGVDKGWSYMKTGYDTRDVGQKYDYKKTNFGKSKLAKAQQAYTEFIFHLLGAEDQPWYYGAFSRSLYSQAIAKGKTEGLKGRALKEFVNNLQQNPSDEMLTWAKEDAETAIYTNRTALGDLGRAIQKTGVGEIIAPFTRTPSAVAMQIINYSPIGVVKEIHQQIKKGELNQRSISQAGGRSVIGTGTLWLGTQLFKAGLITLGFPKEERERKLFEVEGRKPNSIKVGGKWRDVQALGPVGNLLIIGGYFQQALDSKGSPTEAMVEAMAGGAKSFTEQTFVRGVNLAVDALTDPEASFERWFTSMAGSVVPTLVADIARAQDDISRLAVGPKERLQSRIPIYRKGLPPKIDIFGQDLPRYGGNVLETMADPTRPSKIRQDVVVDELRRLWDKGIKVSPTQLGDKQGYDILTKEENTQLWQRSGELVYKVLFEAISNEDYQNLDNFAKGRMIELLTREAKSAAKAEMVNIKLGQGKSIMKLAESGLLSINSLEMLKFYREEE